MAWLFVLVGLTCGRGGAAEGLRLARVISSSMVMQAEMPALSGWAAPGATVSLTTSDGEHHSVAAATSDGAFTISMAPREAKIADEGIGITVASGGKTINLADILFGDVWLCSGQSNMEFSVAEAFDRDDIIATAGRPGLRLFATQKNASTTELDDLADVQSPGGGWVVSSPKTVCGAEYDNDGYSANNTGPYCGPHCGPSASVKSFARKTWGFFSAACFLHGRALLRETGRPQGMLESCWGGTKIESWSPKAALNRCNASATTGDRSRSDGRIGEATQLALTERTGADVSDPPPPPLAGPNAGLWNGMIAPLLKFPIKGAIWYQGEANAQTTASGNHYFCQMTSLIFEWRARWALEGNAHATRSDPDFPFIVAALAPVTGGGQFPIVRYSQWGVAAPAFMGDTHDNARPAPIKNVGVANLVDLLDVGSPCGSVHIRNKTVVGERLARAALALGYNRSSTRWAGPVPTNIALSGSGEMTIKFTEGGGSVASALEFISLVWNNQTTQPTFQNFEVLVGGSNWSGTWTRVPAAVVRGAPGTVKLELPLPASAASAVQAVRYAWDAAPPGQQLFNGDLPAMPFLAQCDFAGCTLVPPGEVPELGPPTPGPSPPPAPPAPPAPPSSLCTFRNNTDIEGAVEIATAEVPFMDKAACCGACRAFKGCAAAEMMGSGTMHPPFLHSACRLFGAAGTQKALACKWPCARVAITPGP